MNPRSVFETKVIDCSNEEEGQLPIASFQDRTQGAMIDGLLFGVLFMITGIFSLIYVPPGFPHIQEHFGFALGGIAVLWFALQLRFLLTSGQTIGKYFAGTKIVTLAGQRPGWVRLILLRYVLLGLISWLVAYRFPSFSNIILSIDALLLTGKDRRCLHDWLAGTKVVKIPDSTATATSKPV